MSWLLDAGVLSQPAKRIAGTGRRHSLTIVSGNDRHFRRPGLGVFNPFKEL